MVMIAHVFGHFLFLLRLQSLNPVRRARARLSKFQIYFFDEIQILNFKPVRL
jgi:hypothetical protein